MIFKAYSLTNEIDLNKIASKCNIPKNTPGRSHLSSKAPLWQPFSTGMLTKRPGL